MRKLKCVLSLVLFLVVTNAQASHEHQLDRLLKSSAVPEGVVFEILSRRENYLDWAIPEVQKMVVRLREQYPEIALAVVSHSREQFALAKAKNGQYASTQAKVKSLVENQDIPVHVCGIYVERRGLNESDFPTYVNVSESGPIQIGLYREMGYKVIMITGH